MGIPTRLACRSINKQEHARFQDAVQLSRTDTGCAVTFYFDTTMIQLQSGKKDYYRAANNAGCSVP
jgi:hypothetical protein